MVPELELELEELEQLVLPQALWALAPLERLPLSAVSLSQLELPQSLPPVVMIRPPSYHQRLQVPTKSKGR